MSAPAQAEPSSPRPSGVAPRSRGAGQVAPLKPKRRARLVLAELGRLADVQRAAGVVIDWKNWAYIVATLIDDRGEQLDVLSLEDRLIKFRVADRGAIDLDEARAIIASVDRWRAKRGKIPVPCRKIAAMLGVSPIEREAAELKLIPAIGVSREAAREAARERKRARDRERKRAKRSRVPREVYLSGAISKAKPWQAAGVSRATWYRQKARETGVSPHPIYILDGRHTCLNGLAAPVSEPSYAEVL